MRKVIIFIIYIAFTLSSQGAIKIDADSAYVRGDYAQAIALYEELLTEGESPEVYYNLGNSYFKIDNMGKSILNYERALLLDPGNSDIRANLDIARSKTQDNLVSTPSIFFVVWVSSLINTMSVKQWAIFGILAFIILLFSLGVFFFTMSERTKKISFICAICFLIFTIVSNIFAFSQKSRLINRNDAIVLTPSVTVRSTPSESGTSLFILHEGTKVTIKDDTMQEWKEIELSDGKVGWILKEDIEII